MNIKKIKRTAAIYVKLDAATKAALPVDKEINISEWVREAIREKAAREGTHRLVEQKNGE